MKKIGFLIPVILFLVFSMVGSRLFASGSIKPTTLIIVMIIFLGIILLSRPKTAAPKPASDVEKKVRGDFAENAFLDNPQLAAKFQSALKDYCGNMPKSALNKLGKLAPQCRTDEERYAVAMATAMCHISVQKYPNAIQEYNKAIVLHPTSELALSIGSCQQRLGELNKAIDSYEFALDLDETNIEARSSLATAYVADGDYDTALEQAMLVLEQNETHASALATAAICYGLRSDALMQKYYTNLAVENGYSQKKIDETISALKKRK